MKINMEFKLGNVIELRKTSGEYITEIELSDLSKPTAEAIKSQLKSIYNFHTEKEEI